MNKTLMIVLGGGGHTKQMLKLVSLLGKEYDYEYLVSSGDSISEKKIEIKGKVFRIINPRGMDDKNILKVIIKFVPSTIQALSVLFKSKSCCILSAGPALSIHISYLGKFLFGKKVIFLESWSRVESSSMAGKFCYPFADLFFVQWPEGKKNYPHAIYAGRLG
ncbi:MAG: PssD/Cps14F family polysaccharide biosynthesis glycosyltransferase [archaeon]